MGLTVGRQMDLKLTINRQRRLFFFYRRTSKMQVRINRQKSSKYFASLIHLQGIPAPEEKLQNWFSCSQKHPIQSFNLLLSKNISKIYRWKAKTSSKPQLLMLIEVNTEVNIYLTFRFNFRFYIKNNRQPSNAPKINHKPSKLEKNNRQSCHPIEVLW